MGIIFKKLLFFIHRWLGLAMSFLFVVWFLSGFVMIYHSFPKPKLNYKGQKFINAYDSILNPNQLVNKHKVSAITLEMMNDKAVYRLNGRSNIVYNALTLEPINELTQQDCQKIVSSNFKASVTKVKELNDFDQWIPWSYYGSYFPLYKFWLNDGAQVYVSAKTGRIVQETTRLSRLMAWLGPIPHWMYFKKLRLKAALWSSLVIWLSSIGCIVCLSGIIAGILRLKRQRKNKQWYAFSPYKKWWFKWHHIFGFVFGFFVFTFILSGLMSLADVPNWLVKKENGTNYYQLWNESDEILNERQCSFTIVLHDTAFDSAKKIVWHKVMGNCFYEVYTDFFTKPQRIIIDKNQVKPMPILTQHEIEGYIKKTLPHKSYRIAYINSYNQYYSSSKKRKMPLPVYQIALNDEYKTELYIHPQSGELLKVVNQNSKLKWWLYRGLHCFDFGWFRQMEWLRKGWLILLSVGGTAVSVTALVLSYSLLKRKMSS